MTFGLLRITLGLPKDEPKNVVHLWPRVTWKMSSNWLKKRLTLSINFLLNINFICLFFISKFDLFHLYLGSYFSRSYVSLNTLNIKKLKIINFYVNKSCNSFLSFDFFTFIISPRLRLICRKSYTQL